MHSYACAFGASGKRPSKAAPFQLRWQVDGTERQEKFATKTLADARRAELLTATRKGEPFDTETGLPVSEVRERNRTGWYAHARAHAARKWPSAAAKHRASIAESGTIATMAACPTGKGRPEDDLLRRALYQWGFNAGRHDQELPEAEAKALKWVERNAPTVVDLDSAKRMRTV
uniref:hypothetical protein n=1 Tax=Streptomyces asoensis TaxID=249586 RepID=UPI00209BEE53|nr:hypothetical protein [Streptomyces asoensis]